MATYEVRACLPPDGTQCSDPLEIGTIMKPGTQHYGDVAGVPTGDLPPLPGYTPPDGVADQIDVDAYTSTVEGPSTPSAHMTWVDIHGIDPVSAPNYFLNVSDLQLILFSLNGDTYPPAGFLSPGQCGSSQPASSPPVGDPALFGLKVDSNSIAPDQTVEVDVFVHPPASANIGQLGAYEVALSVAGGEEGGLVLRAVKVDSDRPDYVFGSAPTVTVGSVFGSRISNALATGGVLIADPAYLGTFTYKAGANARGVFDIAVRPGAHSFLNDRNAVLLSSDSGEPEPITVRIE